MRKILLAYLFLLFDLELVVNGGYFSLLLPLAAVCLLVSGFGALAAENERFEQCVTCAVVVGVLRCLLFVAASFGAIGAERAYLILAAFGVVALFFAMTYRMLCAFHEIEEENNLFAASRFCLIGEVCLCAIGLGCIWGSVSPTLGVNFMLLSVVASGLFFFALYRLQVVYLRFQKIMQ